MARETKTQREQREAAEATAAPPQALNAVIVTRAFDDEGKVAVEVSKVGDVQLTEVQTILELGVTRFRELALGQKPS